MSQCDEKAWEDSKKTGQFDILECAHCCIYKYNIFALDKAQNSYAI